MVKGACGADLCVPGGPETAKDVARIMGVDHGRLRVLTEDVGGAFGMLLPYAMSGLSALYIAGVMSLGIEVGMDRKIAIDAAYISTNLRLCMADSIILATARACMVLQSTRS